MLYLSRNGRLFRRCQSIRRILPLEPLKFETVASVQLVISFFAAKPFREYLGREIDHITGAGGEPILGTAIITTSTAPARIELFQKFLKGNVFFGGGDCGTLQVVMFRRFRPMMMHTAGVTTLMLEFAPVRDRVIAAIFVRPLAASSNGAGVNVRVKIIVYRVPLIDRGRGTLFSLLTIRIIFGSCGGGRRRRFRVTVVGVGRLMLTLMMGNSF